MNKIVEIENALNRINGDVFQAFCDHFLFYILNPNSVDPIGSVIGKEKSRKGIPDSYFTTKDGKLVFAGYTTKERLDKDNSFINKLKKDIEDCFDVSKTEIQPTEIHKVILCFTGKLEPSERKELYCYCESFNKSCELQLHGIRDLSYSVLDYPYLAKYLNVTVDTGQILTPSDFISDYEKSKFSTPLSNKFLGREKELEEGIDKLKGVDILMVHGAAGTGKSKYAIELCKQFCQFNKNYTFLCIGNKGLPLWDDLNSYLRKDNKYIILVDDANRLVKNFQWLLSFVNNSDRQKIKVIVTVRDYALGLLQNKITEFNYFAIEIKNFTKDELTAIVKSEEFNIQNPAFIERILDIAKGNSRLAIMCARVAKESNNLLSLTDASQIYDEYFKKLFQEVDLLKDNETLIALALISFFGSINKENREFCESTFSSVKLDEDYFWELCYKLNEFEIVNLYENQVVKISDQIFSTYIFYKVVIDKESLNFKFFLDNYLEYEYRIVDTIIPVIKTFSYKKIEDKLKNNILSKWHEIEQVNVHEKSLKYLDLFWFYLYSQTLVYFKKHIDNLEEPIQKNYRYTPVLNEFSSGTDKIIEILTRTQNLKAETFKDAFELILYYGLKIPDKLPAIVYSIKEHFLFTRLSYQYDDEIQHIVLDTLIARAQEGNNVEIFENILNEIIPHFLKIEFHETSSDGRRQITLYTFHLLLSDSIKSFRKKCFEYLERKSLSNKNIALQTIYNLPIFDYKHSDEIYDFDKEFIFSIFYNHFDNQKFEDCFVFLDVIDKLDILQKDYPIEITDKLRSKVYDLVEVLKPEKNNKKKAINWKEDEEQYKDEIIQFCKDFGLPEIIELFNNITSILKIANQSHVEWQLSNALEIIISDIGRKNPALFLDLITEYFNKYSFRLNFLSIFISFFSTNSKHYFQLFSIIPSSHNEIKIAFHIALKIDHTTDKHLFLLYEDLKLTIQNIQNQYFFWDLTFISKYTKLKSELSLYEEVLDIILHICDGGNTKISVGFRFLEKCLEIPDFPLPKIVKAYFYSNKFEQHFDYKKDVLKRLVEKDYEILIQLLKFSYPDRISYHDIEHQNYDFIWELPNYEAIINSLFIFFAEEKRYFFWERAINGFFPTNQNKTDDKPIQLLHKVIQEYSQESNYIELVFNIICYTYPLYRDEFLKEILTLNSDFEIFTRLELVPRSGVYMGSRIPHIQSHKESWEKVLVVLEDMPKRIDFLEHKEYVERQIQYCTIDIQREMKVEFLEEYL